MARLAILFHISAVVKPQIIYNPLDNIRHLARPFYKAKGISNASDIISISIYTACHILKCTHRCQRYVWLHIY